MKKIILLLFMLFALHCLTSAQSPFAFLLHKTYAQRFMQLDSLFYEDKQVFDDSTSFFKAVNSLALLAEKEGDEKLYLEAQFIKWRFYPFSAMRTDYTYLVPKLTLLLQQAEQQKIKHLQIRIRDNLGLYYNKLGNISAAAEQYLNSYYLLKDISLKELPNKRDFVYHELASIYYSLSDYENAKKFLLEADSLPVFAVPRFRKMREAINMTNTLGLVCRNTSRFDSAVYYFTKARDIALREQDSVWVGIAGGNIGITYFIQKKYAEAVPLLEEDIQLSTQAKEFHNAANSLIKLAAISLAYQNKSKARQQLLQARALTAVTYDPYKLLDDLFPLMARYYAAEGNTALAYRYADSATMVRDSIAIQTNKIALARAQQKIEIEHHKTEIQQLENQKRVQALIRNGLLCILILLITITFLLIGRQRLLKKQKQYAEEQEKLALQELDSAKHQLHYFTSNIREKNDLIERLTAEMSGLQTTFNKEVIHYRQETLEQLRQSTILTDEEWKSFRTNFEKVYPEWFKGLNEKLPGLSAADIRFLALTKLKFNAREMAAILGISPASLRMSRHRLRKKYNLTEEESLELLTDSI